MQISDTWRRQLTLRRAWLGEGDVRGPSGDVGFNDVDLVSVDLLRFALGASRIVVDDPALRRRLMTVYDALPGAGEPNPIVDASRSPESAVVLVAVTRLGRGMPKPPQQPDDLVVVYGWRNGWSPADVSGLQEPSDQLFVPLGEVGPALWRSTLQVLVAPSALPKVRRAIDLMTSTVNDGDVDVFALLDHVQTLELKLRGRLPADKKRLSADDVNNEWQETLSRLERELSDARRTIALQQNALAVAYQNVANARSP